MLSQNQRRCCCNSNSIAALVQEEEGTVEGASKPLAAGTSSNATAEEKYQKWGNRLASRCRPSQLPKLRALRVGQHGQLFCTPEYDTSERLIELL